MQEFIHWLVVGFSFGCGFTLGQLALTGLLALIGRGKTTTP